MLYSPVKNKYDVNNSKQAQDDLDKMLEIKSIYKRFKQVKDFSQTLVTPRPIEGKSQFRFYSRFECGNLLKAIKIPVTPELNGIGVAQKSCIKYEYDLYLDMDVNTDGHMHWYYFQTISRNMPPGTKIKMNIRNLVRSKSLCTEGMLPRICYGHTNVV